MAAVQVEAAVCLAKLDVGAQRLFGRLAAEVCQEALYGGVPTLLTMLTYLAKMPASERAQCLQAFVAMAAQTQQASQAPPPGLEHVLAPAAAAGSRRTPATPPRKGGRTPQPASPPSSRSTATPGPASSSGSSPGGSGAGTPTSPPPGLGLAPGGGFAGAGLAAALANVASFSDASRVAIVRAGGLTNLIQLMEDGTAEAQAQAAGTVFCLLDGSVDNQATFVEAGGLAAACRMAGWAVAASDLAAQRGAAKLLAMLAKGDATCAAAMVEGGGVAALLQLAKGSSLEICATAVHALRQLVLFSEEAKVLVVEAGTISTLVRVLQSGGPAELRGYAAGLLSTLVDGNKQYQAAVLSEGGLIPLVNLTTGGSADASRRAASVLAILGRSFPELCGAAMVAGAGASGPASAAVGLAEELQCRAASTSMDHTAAKPVVSADGVCAL